MSSIPCNPEMPHPSTQSIYWCFGLVRKNLKDVTLQTTMLEMHSMGVKDKEVPIQGNNDENVWLTAE